MGDKSFPNLTAADNRIWKYRHIRNLSQEDIGRLFEYKTTAPISNWEKGKKLPSLTNAIRLAEILHSSVETLFPGIARSLQSEIDDREKRLPAHGCR